jgi:excinuclease ABC subunit B
LRSDISLIQTMGRAARHIVGEVVMYADVMTGSIKRAIAEVDRRRDIQIKYNLKHDVTPQQITKPFREKLVDQVIEEALDLNNSKKAKYQEIDYMQLPPNELKKEVKKLTEMMRYEAEMLNFEEAAKLRDKVRDLKKISY